jgi:hypothetical protein
MRCATITLLFVLTTVSVSSQSSQNSAKVPAQQKATLVEARSTPRCYGLDCPPFPVPPELDFCFQVGDKYYAAKPRSWGVPWSRQGERLVALQGQSVEIAVTEREIRVVAPQVTIRLKLVHGNRAFSLHACNHT